METMMLLFAFSAIVLIGYVMMDRIDRFMDEGNLRPDSERKEDLRSSHVPYFPSSAKTHNL